MTAAGVPRRRVARREWQDALKRGGHGLNSESHHAALTLLMFMDEEGVCFPGQELLADAMAKTSRSVRAALKGLDQSGWVERRRGGRHGDRSVSTRYLSTLPTGSQLPDGDDLQIVGSSAGLGDRPVPNRKLSVSQPEAERLPTGSQLPTNSQRTPRENSQEKTTAPGGFPAAGSPGDAPGGPPLTRTGAPESRSTLTASEPPARPYDPPP